MPKTIINILHYYSYIDWLDKEKVFKIVNAIFENGEPYVSAWNGFSDKFKNIKIIRNQIAHNSVHSKDQFDTMVRNELSASRVGCSPAEFLTAKKNSTHSFFDIYITQIRNAAFKIATYFPN